MLEAELVAHAHGHLQRSPGLDRVAHEVPLRELDRENLPVEPLLDRVAQERGLGRKDVLATELVDERDSPAAVGAVHVVTLEMVEVLGRWPRIPRLALRGRQTEEFRILDTQNLGA